MTGELDLRTLSLATGTLVVVLTMAMAWVGLTRRIYPGFLLWMLGSAAGASCLLIGFWMRATPSVLAVLAANTAASAGQALINLGLEDFLGRRRTPWLQALPVAITMATAALLTSGGPAEGARVAIGEGAYVLQTGWCLWLLVSGVPPLLGGRNRLLELTVAVQGTWSLLRMVHFATGRVLLQTLLSASTLESITFLIYPAVLALQVFGLTGLNLQRLESDLRGALEEVRTLRGIIPICSYCKKIRDDEGSWQQVEAYVSDHTEAAFSHGICPRCLQVHFPEEDPPG